MGPIKAGGASLIKFLVHNGMVSSDEARTAAQELERQENGASIIDLLERKGLIVEEQVDQKLADRLRIPHVDLPAVALDPAVIALVREELATRHKVVPLRADLKSLILATANPLDRDALHAIEFATGLRVHPEVATLTAVRDAIEHAYHLDEALNQYLRGVNDENEVPLPQLRPRRRRSVQHVPPLRYTVAVQVRQLRQAAADWQICPFCGVPASRTDATAPRAPAPQAPVPPAATPQAPERTSETRQYRALVVDDTADFRRLISFTLEHSGLPVSVETASNGREAIEKAQADPPDFIVLDIMMPEMDGFEVCERLRANVRTAFVPILMLTALDDAANRACGFLAGTDDYIGKPFARAELLARVRRLIERTYGTSLPTRTEVTPGGRMTSLSAAA